MIVFGVLSCYLLAKLHRPHVGKHAGCLGVCTLPGACATICLSLLSVCSILSWVFTGLISSNSSTNPLPSVFDCVWVLYAVNAHVSWYLLTVFCIFSFRWPNSYALDTKIGRGSWTVPEFALANSHTPLVFLVVTSPLSTELWICVLNSAWVLPAGNAHTSCLINYDCILHHFVLFYGHMSSPSRITTLPWVMDSIWVPAALNLHTA